MIHSRGLWMLSCIMCLTILIAASASALLDTGSFCSESSDCASGVCNLDRCVPVLPASWENTPGYDDQVFSVPSWDSPFWNLSTGVIGNATFDVIPVGTSSIPPKVMDMATQSGTSGVLAQTGSTLIVTAQTSAIVVYTMEGSEWKFVDSLDLNMTIADFALVRDVLRPKIAVIGQEPSGRSVYYELYLSNSSKLTLPVAPHVPWNLTGGATPNFRYYALSCAQEDVSPYDGFCAAVAGNVTSQTSTVALFSATDVVGSTPSTTVPQHVYAPIAVRTLLGTVQDSTPTNPRFGMVHNGNDQFSFYATSMDLSRIVKLDLNTSDTYSGVVPLNYYSAPLWNGTAGIKFENARTSLVTNWANTYFFLVDYKNVGHQNPCALYVEAISNGYQTLIQCMDDTATVVAQGWGGGVGNNSIQYQSESFIFGATAFRNAPTDVPIICQFTYVADAVGNTNYHELSCAKWNGVSFTMGALALFPPFTFQDNSNFYLIGLDRTPNIISLRPTQTSDQSLLVANSLFSVNPTTLVVTSAYPNFTTAINKSRVILADTGYGRSLELIAASSTMTSLLSVGVDGIGIPPAQFVPPTVNQTFYTNGGFFGYYSTQCQGTFATFKAVECSGTNYTASCNYLASPGYQERLGVRCPFASDVVFGNYSASTPEASCFVPFVSGTVTATVYLQSQTDPNDYTHSAPVEFIVSATDCNQLDQLVDAPITNLSPGGGGNGGGVTPGSEIDEVPEIFDAMLGSGTTTWKLFVAILMIIGVVVGVMQIPTVERSPHGMWIGIIVGFLMFLFCTIAGLIPAFVVVIIAIILIAVFLLWRAIFPATGGSA